MTAGWHEATVVSTKDLAERIRQIEIEPRVPPPPRLEPGSHIKVRVAGLMGQNDVRHYSLLPVSDPRLYRIVVLVRPDGRGGSRAMGALEPGEALEIAGPANNFPLSLDAEATLLVAGGIGITPLVGMAAALRASERPVRLVYAARSRTRLVLVDELERLLGPDMTQRATDSGPRLDLEHEISALPAQSRVYVCGPIGMLEAARSIWAAQRRDPTRLHIETFGSSGHRPAVPFVVHLRHEEQSIKVPADRSMLDMLNEAGIATIGDCLKGECGVCAMDVIESSGPLDHRDVYLSEAQRAAGRKMCPCVSRVAGGTVTVDSGYRQRKEAAGGGSILASDTPSCTHLENTASAPWPQRTTSGAESPQAISSTQSKSFTMMWRSMSRLAQAD